MKKTFILLTISALSLAGCAKKGTPPEQQSPYCQEILYKMHHEPHRYKIIGRNKLLSTTHAKLIDEYYKYKCHEN